MVADGWVLERVTPPTRLFSANGLRTGPDGRIYVAQVSGSQISAVDPDTGAIETISAMGGGIVGPDDLAFDDTGNLYATEITEGRVSEFGPDGTTRVIRGDMPVANPITFHNGRLIAGECRPGGRIMELDRDGGAPRIILDDVPMANAFEVGPDGKLYFPVMGTNEIWRIGLQGGSPEVVARDLGMPDSVKFDAQGYIVSTQVASGQVLRIDPRDGARTILATIAPGLDNCTFVGERLFVSSICGQITEILRDGSTRALVPGGLQWPLGLAMNDRGVLFVADGAYTYTLAPGHGLQLAAMLFMPDFPGYTRGAVAAGADGWFVTTANGDVAHFRPGTESKVLASGFEELYGVTTGGEGIAFVDRARGCVLSLDGGQVRTLAAGLRQPKGVAIGADGSCYVTEAGAGRIVSVSGGAARTVVDGLTQPEGLAVRGQKLYVVDAGAREIVQIDLVSGERVTLASRLPVGSPVGVTPIPLKAFPPLCGAMGPFADIACGPDDSLYLSADAEGSILAMRPSRH